MHRTLIWLSVVVAAAASVASSPGGDGSGGPGDIIGSSSAVNVSLDSTNASSDHTATATLTVNQPIESGSGEVKLNASFASSPAAHVTMTIASDAGAQNSTDVDTSAQSDVSLGITTWDGCADSCSETLTVSFDLDDTSVDGAVDINFTLDGSASVASADTGDNTAAPGSISIDVQ